MQLGRNVLFVSLLGAAVGGPYLATQTLGKKAEPGAAEASAAGSAAPRQVAGGDRPASAASAASAAGAAGRSQPEPVLEGPPVRRLEEIIRFDVSPSWVTQRWSRVFTCTPESSLRGYRVPLVTGTGEHDLAGSLTYYFDNAQRVQRITFFGATGDVRPLVSLVTSRYQFIRKGARDAGLQLYQASWDGILRSELRIRHTPVVYAEAPQARYTVELSCSRPNGFRMFSEDPRVGADFSLK